MNGVKTYLGILVALIPTVAGIFGYTVTPEFTEGFPEVADQFIQLVGLAIAFYGRAVATTPGMFSKQ